MFKTDIVEKCKANDRNAQLTLYRKYCDGMYAVAMRFVKNSDDAEDVLQEAFIKAFQKLEQFRKKRKHMTAKIIPTKPPPAEICPPLENM